MKGRMKLFGVAAFIGTIFTVVLVFVKSAIGSEKNLNSCYSFYRNDLDQLDQMINIQFSKGLRVKAMTQANYDGHKNSFVVVMCKE